MGVVDNRTFKEAMLRGQGIHKNEQGKSLKSLSFQSESEEVERYQSAYTGMLNVSGMVMALKRIFLDEGIFTIRVTFMGPNLCILEELVKGEVEIFVEERRSWWERWFKSLNPWKPGDVDMERIVWHRISGIPCHVWGLRFFIMLVELRGSIIKCDEQILAKLNMEEARICIKTSTKDMIND